VRTGADSGDGANGMGVRFLNLPPESACGDFMKFLSNRATSLYYGRRMM